LLIDYGPAESGFGDSLQAMRAGQPVDPLAAPGEVDITAHVDFAAFAAAARMRFSRTAAASSLPESEQFRDAKAPVETPPLRVKNPCFRPGSCKGSAVRNSALMRFRIQRVLAALNRIAPGP